jgi:hypothetical protein
MPLRYYRHIETEEIKKTLKGSPGEDWEEVIVAPNGKFMVKANASTGRSKIKDLKPMLTERARNHSRDTLLDDTIQINKDNQFGVNANLLNEKGQRRRKIDDI